MSSRQLPEFDLSQPLVGEQREKALNLIFRWTHKDYKSEPGQEKRLLVLRTEGASSVLLSSLTDAEIADRLPSSLRKQQQADAKRQQAKAVSPQKGLSDSLEWVYGAA